MTIKEVSEKYSIVEDTLRYYEKVGLIRPVTRKNGIRQYGEAEIANIEFVKCMRSAGLSIKILAQYLKLLDEGESTKEERLKLLKDQRNNLAQKADELKKAIDRLDYKINLLYENGNNKLKGDTR